MERGKGKRAQNKKRAVVLALSAAVFLTSLLFALLPGGYSTAWRQVFSAFGLSGFSAVADGYPMSLHVLEVGKADALLIECEGKFLVVDGGTPDRGEEVCRYLTRRGVEKIDLMVNTHPDADHIGGLKAVLEQFPVSAFWTPVLPPEIIPADSAYIGVMDALREKGIAPENPARGRELSLGGLKIRVLAPVKARDTVNNNSIVLHLIYGGTSFLLMGDAEAEEEADLLGLGGDLCADVLKVGHHGSKTSSTQRFLEAVRPKYAAISVAQDTNGLPDREVLKRLSALKIRTGRTDADGTLLYLSDGEQIIYKTER